MLRYCHACQLQMLSHLPVATHLQNCQIDPTWLCLKTQKILPSNFTSGARLMEVGIVRCLSLLSIFSIQFCLRTQQYQFLFKEFFFPSLFNLLVVQKSRVRKCYDRGAQPYSFFFFFHPRLTYRWTLSSIFSSATKVYWQWHICIGGEWNEKGATPVCNIWMT